jgi:hypothetical protein
MSRFLTLFLLGFVLLHLRGCCEKDGENGDQAKASELTEQNTTTEEYKVEVRITHEEVLREGSSYNVYIDEEELIKLKPGQKEVFTLNLAKGVHTFYVKNDGV